MTEIIAQDDGWIVPVKFRRMTPNRYHKGFQTARVQPIELVVYHYTAGGFDGSLRWLTSRDSGVSAHFVLAKTGDLWQTSPLRDRTWHAGGQTSSWRKKGQVNNRSIGVESENWGPLKIKPDGVVTYKDLPHKGEVFMAPDGTAWDAYTEAQVLASEALTKALVGAFPILANDSGPPNGRLVGHQHVDPSRKKDPGPAFPWSRVIAAARTPLSAV